MPSLPAGSSRSSLFFTWPTTLTVGLILSCWIIRRIPLGSKVTMGLTFDVGRGGTASAFLAQAGNATGFVSLGVKISVPPKPFEDMGLPEGRGVRTAVIAVSFTRYCLGTRLTSSSVTFLIARISSSGELRPSTAIASDQEAARSEIEFYWNSSSAISCRFDASMRSFGTPFFT